MPMPVESMYVTCDMSRISLRTPSCSAFMTDVSICPLSRPSVMRPVSSMTVMSGSMWRVARLRIMAQNSITQSVGIKP